MQTLNDVLLALFLALGSAWFAADLVRKLRAGNTEPRLDKTPAAPAPPPPAPAPVAAPAPVVAPALSAHAPAAVDVPPAEEAPFPAGHLAAIAATVHHLFRGRARLVSAFAAPALSAGHPPAHGHVDWAREGRRDIFSSHRVR